MTLITHVARRHLLILNFLIGTGVLLAAAAVSADERRFETRPGVMTQHSDRDDDDRDYHGGHHHHDRLPLTLYAPTALPDALPERQATDVKFTVLLAGGAASAHPDVALQIPGVARNVPMHDDGHGPDLSAGDRIYSALVHFDPSDARAGHCYQVRASTRTNKRVVLSAERRLCVSRIPIGFAPSDFSASNVVTFGTGSQAMPVVADEVLIGVTPGLSENQIIALATRVGGHIVGSLPGANVYQIRLAGSETAAQLQQTIATLQGQGGVLFAVPNAIGGLQGPPVLPVMTNDPQLGTQWNLDRVKARQAWAITTGDAAQLTAVIDTGADFDHPDFWATPAGTTTRFATSGSNLVAADCTSGTCAAVSVPTTCHATNVCNTANAATDTYGHGTLVSGFFGAATDNSTDIAGATWQGSLLAVRYATNDSTASAANLLAGINYAVAQGARILSISTAMPAAFVGTLVCPSVASAESAGRLVVAAAGNDGATTNNYPAACAGAMPVANSDVDGSNLDVIHTGTLPSNYGGWISVAAPGTSVPSTARTPAACPGCTYSSATGYLSVTGTSFSTPLAAGAAGLILARSPSTTNASLRSLLASTGVALQAPAAHIHRIDLLAALMTFNTAPTGLNLSPTACIPDGTNTAAGVSAGTLTTVDADAGSTGHAYTIVGGADQAKFGIGGGSADQLTLSDGVLSYAAKPSYAVTVRSTDAGDLTFDQGFVVAVCAPVVNLPPVVTGGTFSVPEFSAVGTPVGTVVATDPEGQPLAYSITSGNTGGAFVISGTGQITVANQPELDAETTPIFNLTVNVSDGVNNVAAAVTVNVTPITGPIPNPILVFVNKETHAGSDGNLYDYYNFAVQNWYAYPGSMFVSTALYGACGLNATPSRTWVDFFNAADDSYIYGFCALGQPNDMNGIWFAVPTGTAPPANVYIKLIDRSTTTYTEYPSNVVSPPFP